MSEKVTPSVIKEDVGGCIGHSSSHPLIQVKALELLNDPSFDQTWSWGKRRHGPIRSPWRRWNTPSCQIS